MSENTQNTRLTRTELIDAAAAALNRMEPPQAGSFCGLKARVERLTELLIAALFPRHAAEMLPVSERLEEAAAVLHICLELCGAPEPERIVETLLAALPELRRVLETDLQAAYRGDPTPGATTRSSSATRPFRPSRPIGWPTSSTWKRCPCCPG